MDFLNRIFSGFSSSRRQEKLEKENRKLRFFNKVHKTIRASASPREFSRILAEHLREVMKVDAFFLDALQPDQELSRNFANFDTIKGDRKSVV